MSGLRTKTSALRPRIYDVEYTHAPSKGLSSSNDLCNFDDFDASFTFFFSRETFSTRSRERCERLNMMSGFGMAFGMVWGIERSDEMSVRRWLDVTHKKIDWAQEEISSYS